jgi:hypothetical protein
MLSYRFYIQIPEQKFMEINYHTKFENGCHVDYTDGRKLNKCKSGLTLSSVIFMQIRQLFQALL